MVEQGGQERGVGLSEKPSWKERLLGTPEQRNAQRLAAGLQDGFLEAIGGNDFLKTSPEEGDKKKEFAEKIFGKRSEFARALREAVDKGPVSAVNLHDILVDTFEQLQRHHGINMRGMDLKDYQDPETGKYVIMLGLHSSITFGAIFDKPDDLLAKGSVTYISGSNSDKNTKRMVLQLDEKGILDISEEEKRELTDKNAFMSLSSFRYRNMYDFDARMPQAEEDRLLREERHRRESQTYSSWDEFETIEDSSVRLLHVCRTLDELLTVVHPDSPDAVELIRKVFQAEDGRLESDARVIAIADDDGDTHMLQYMLHKVDSILRGHRGNLGEFLDLNAIQYGERLHEFQEESESMYKILHTLFSLQRAASQGSEQVLATARQVFVDSQDFVHGFTVPYTMKDGTIRPGRLPHHDNVDWLLGLCALELNSQLEPLGLDLMSILPDDASSRAFLERSQEKAAGVYYDKLKNLINVEDEEDEDEFDDDEY